MVLEIAMRVVVAAQSGDPPTPPAELHKEEALVRFDRSVLGKPRGLTFELVEERMGRWLSGEQIRALLARRDVIVARADRLVAERGVSEVVVP